MTHDLLYPMFAMVVLTFIVLGIMFVTRVKAVRSGKVEMRYFKTYSVTEPPEDILKTQRHFANLFEMPVLFYAACLAGMVTGAKGPTVLTFAWLFVVARIVHACIHMGSNRTKYRMRIFGIGCFCLLALWICIIMQACGGGI